MCLNHFSNFLYSFDFSVSEKTVEKNYMITFRACRTLRVIVLSKTGKVRQVSKVIRHIC